MESISSYERVLKLKVRYGTTLLILNIVFIISIFFLNTNIKTNNDTINWLSTIESQSSNQLAKYRCFKLKNSNLYQNLTIASIIYGNPIHLDSAGLKRWSFTNIELWYSLLDGELNSWNTHSSYLDKPFDTLRSQSKSFGIKCERIFQTEFDSTKRLHQLISATDSCFTNSNIKLYLKKSVLEELNTIHSSDNWYNLVRWIIFGDWPPNGIDYAGTGMGISYTNRFEYYKSTREKNYYLFYKIWLTTSRDSVESILKDAWESSFLNKEKYHLETPKLSLASIGFSIGIDDILLAVGPILLFFQILFMLYWQKEKELLSSHKSLQQSFVFPDFTISGNPFGKKKSSSFILYFFPNLLWSLFLILPTVILLFGFFLRYDIASILRYPLDQESIFQVTLRYKSTDTISLLIDILNLICLTLSLIIVIFITKSSNHINEIRYPLKGKRLLLIFFLFLGSLFMYFMLKLSNAFPEYSIPISNEDRFTWYLNALHLTLWVFFVIISFINKATFVFYFCIFILILNSFLLFS